MTKTENTAVVGAGLAGLTCARALADAGHSVVVFDKGRGLGGRMASRRKDGWRFDHGAVALRPTDDSFATFLATAHDMGHAEAWDAANGWTGVPGMSTIVKSLAEGLETVSSQRVTGLIKTDAGWIIEGPQHAENLIFDRVILAIPHPQAQAILAPWPALSAQIAKAQMQPCWTLMAGFDAPLATGITYSNRCSDPISVIVRETAKPGRSLPGDGWVIQASAEWSSSHLELDQHQIETLLLAAFFKDIACDPVTPAISMAHRWRYALTTTPLGRAYVMDASLGLAVCGDWCLGRTAQAAHDSGRSLAEAIIESAPSKRNEPAPF
ncbi:NAD(P)/FAD-dependent oxidoreductase [Yoonia algicola]|uniref:FAD-dependent oxidoreductase n=1 Tax=Yoonia algicola TaxID=3137368 RepID=A0AAN0M6E2_9RHOB